MSKSFKYDKMCCLCEHSTAMFDKENFLCKKKGIVTPDFLCSSFVFDPLKKEISVKLMPESIDDEDFKI